MVFLNLFGSRLGFLKMLALFLVFFGWEMYGFRQAKREGDEDGTNKKTVESQQVNLTMERHSFFRYCVSKKLKLQTLFPSGKKEY